MEDHAETQDQADPQDEAYEQAQAEAAEQRASFDAVADLYARTRPEVPADAVEELWQQLQLGDGAHVLEVGAGTGQLTGHLLERGAEVTCVEPGVQLAALCEREFGGPRLHMDVTTFEAWDQGERQFHAITACQAAHWVDPYLFVDRAGDALLPKGGLGLLWHLDLSEGTEFWVATQPLYERYLPDVKEKPPHTIPLYVAAYTDVLRDDARFGPPDRKEIPWRRTFDKDTYLGWLQTNSPVRMLSEEDRAAFVEGHAKVIDDFGGSVERIYETVVLTTHMEEW